MDLLYNNDDIDNEKLPKKMVGNLIEIPVDKIKDISSNIKLLDIVEGIPDTVNILLFVNDVRKQKKYCSDGHFMAIFSPNGDKERDKWTEYFVNRHKLKLVDKIEAEKIDA